MKRKWTVFFGVVVIAAFTLYGVLQYRESERRKPNGQNEKQLRSVYLITATGLRPDHLSSYLYPHIQTPAIDFLAYDGVRFTNAFTTSPSSLMAHLSILSGLYLHRKPMRIAAEALLEKGSSAIPPEWGTLPALLSQTGYKTAAFLSDPELRCNPFFMQMFQEVATGDSIKASWQSSYESTSLVRLAREWVIRNQGRPQFLWLNFSEPTFPFDPPGPYDRQYANHPYDGEIAALDEQIGLLITFLKDLNLFQNSITVFTAPYGESLQGAGRFHHPKEESLRIPLLMAAPGLLERRQEFQDRASLVDIATTVLSLMDSPANLESDGFPLFSEPDQEQVTRTVLYGQNPFPRLFGDPLEFLAQTSRYMFYSNGEEVLLPLGNRQLTAQQEKEWMSEARELMRSEGLAESRPRSKPGSEPHPGAVLENALLLARSGHPRWALDFLQLFRQNLRPTPYLAGLIAELWNEAGDPEAGLQELRATCGKTCSPVLMSLLGRKLMLAGRYEEALATIQSYQEAVRFMSYYDYNIMGQILLAMDRADDAITSFDAALHLNPRLSQVYLHRGSAFEAENLPARAELDFRKAIEMNPGESLAYRRLATLLTEKKLSGQAIPYLKKFLEFHPENYSAKLELAVLQTDSGNPQEAKKLLREVIVYSNDPLLKTRAEEMYSADSSEPEATP